MSETVIEPHPNGQNTTRPVRVCILGSVNAGKTTFLGGLGILREPNRRTPFRITPLDARSAAYLDEIALQLRSGQWPGPSTITTVVRLQVILDGTAMEVTVLDYPGGNFTEALATLRASDAQELHQCVREAEVFLLLLDPTLDLGVDGHSDAMERQQAFLTTLAHLQITHQQAHTEGPDHTIWAAMVLTKCDRYPQLSGRRGAQRLIGEYAGPFRDKLAEYSTQMAYFAVSAVGATRSNEADAAHPLPASQLTPIGYEEIFRWIIRKRVGDRYKLRVKLGVVLACIGVVVVGGATLAIREYNRYQRTLLESQMAQEGVLPAPLKGVRSPAVSDVFSEVIEKRLSEAQAAIPHVLNAEELKSIDEMLHALAARRDLKLAYRDQATSLLENVRRRKEDLAFKSLEDAADTLRERGLIDDYLREWPEGHYATQVRQQRKIVIERQKQQKRDIIKAITVRDSYGFAQKKQAILDYLRDHSDDPERENIQRAVTLATLVGQTQTWEITLKRAGAFSSARRHSIEIWTKGSRPEYTVASQDATSISTYDRTFSIRWKPGDPVKVSLIGTKYLLRMKSLGQEEAAALERDKDDAVAILLLHGQQHLKPSEDWREDFAPEGAYIDCRVRGFQEGDAAVIRDYLIPGSKW